MKNLLLLPIFGLVFATSSDASTVGWAAFANHRLALADGTTPVPQGDLVRLGFFTVSDSQIQTWATAGDKTSLLGAFSEFGSTTVGTPTGIDGTWDANSVTPIAIPNATFAGEGIYYWAVNAPSLSAATEWGIFKNPNVFPTDPLVGPSGSINTDLNQVNPITGIIVGSYGGNDSLTTNPFYKMASIAPVPEPSTFAFGALTVLAAISLRKRRR